MLIQMRNLLRSEYFLDALRITLSIILPFSIFYYFSSPQQAIATGVGALLISLTDSPGTFKDKLGMSVLSSVIFFVVALITSLLIGRVIASGLLIICLCLVFSMFGAFGKRYALLGTMALILMTFVQGLKPLHPLSFSLFILIGGICYYVVSLLQARLWPISAIRHAIGECIDSTADFLRAKAGFYDAADNLADNYMELIRLHNKVSEKQEQVRDLLLRDKKLMHHDHQQGQKYLVVTTLVIDLYEKIGAIQYDYQALQQNLRDTGLLPLIIKVIECLADDLQSIGIALSIKSRVRASDSSWAEIERFKRKLNSLPVNDVHRSLLMKLLDNIDDIYQGLGQISEALIAKRKAAIIPVELPAYQLFTIVESINFDLFKKHLTIQSHLMRFALRLTISCIVAYSLMFLPFGLYSYWILLTVIVVIKPSFGLTKKRNIQRLKGTFLGVLLGVGLLLIIGNTVVHLVLAAVFLLGYFLYLRLNYTWSIMYLTPMVIIGLNVYNNNQSIAFQRMFDTLIGCAIAFASSYIFPSWEVKKHGTYITDVIKANLMYLKKLHDQAEGLPFELTAFKLARKEVYTKLAILSSGIQNMLLEPKKAQGKLKHLYEFEILSHQLSSTIASFFSAAPAQVPLGAMKENLVHAIAMLEESLAMMQGGGIPRNSQAIDLKPGDTDLNRPDHIEQHKIQQIMQISAAINAHVYQYQFGNPGD
jgi:uncharacterized membrane protein YccC